ncbi:MAG: NAD(P)H-dependent oxidoreductase [Candidatus Asgardarchaeia archaeon]
MRVIGLVFSARKKGNCYHCVNYCLEKFKTRGFKTQIINAYDYEIKPCSHCNYQCFPEEVIGKKMKLLELKRCLWFIQRIKQTGIM